MLFVKIKELTHGMLIFCGDILDYYYNQKQVLEKLSEREDLIWLKGNHDHYFLNLIMEKRKKNICLWPENAVPLCPVAQRKSRVKIW